jgi:hypothetical protein
MRTVVSGALAAALFAPACHGQWFHLLESPPNANGNPTVRGVSGDGMVAFGRSLSDCDPTPIRWMRGGWAVTPQSLGFSNGLPKTSSFTGVVLAGDTNCESNPNGHTWRWDPSGGFVALSTRPITEFSFEFILSMSNDAGVIAGYGSADFSAEPEVAVKIGAAPLVRISVVPTDGPLVSGDGSTVVFVGRTTDPFVRTLYRWTAPAGPLVPTVNLPLMAKLLSVSNDGSAVYLHSGLNGSLQRHTMAGGLQTISTTCCPQFAQDATPDGSVVVGLALRAGVSTAYMWDAARGVRWIDSVLTQAGVNLAGAVLTSAVGVSDDGTTIVGEGMPRPWIADLDFVPPPPCDQDFNQDGNADQDDVAYLINVIGGGPNPTERDPDFNQDGNADQDDVAALINTVGGGGCP